MRERFYESEESEMKRGRGLRWSVVKGIVFREPHMNVCVMLIYFIQVCLCLVLTFKNCTVQLTCSIFVFLTRSTMQRFTNIIFKSLSLVSTNNRGLRYKRVPTGFE